MKPSLESLMRPASAEQKKDTRPVFKFKKEITLPDGEKEIREFVSVMGIDLSVNTEGQGTQYDEDEFEDFALDGKTLELLKIYATAIKLNQPPLVEGPTDIGKSKVLEYLAFLTNHHLIYQSFSGQTDVTELIGKYVPNTADARRTFEGLLLSKNRHDLSPESRAILQNSEGRLTEEDCRKIATSEGLHFGDIQWVWQDGTVPRAMEFNDGQGCWLYLDELGAAEPQVLVKLNRIFSRGVQRLEITENGGREVIGGSDFRIIATTNPPSYAGREPFAEDFLRRWVYKKVSNVSMADFIDRLDVLSRKKHTDVPEGGIDVSAHEGISHLINELIALFRDSAQKYLESLPRDAGEQKFRVSDFTDAIRVQEYVRQLQSGDLLETLKDAIEFYYIGKVREDKKDANGKSVHDQLRAIFQELLTQKKAKEQMKALLDALKDPETKRKQEMFDRQAADLRREKDRLRAELGVSPVEPAGVEGSVVRVTVEGEDRIFDPRKEVPQWKTFLTGKNPEYGKLTYPDNFNFTAEQVARIRRYLELGMTKVVFVPEGLVDEPRPVDGKVTTGSKRKAQALEKLISDGYPEKTFQGINYATSGGIGASTGVGSGRFVFYKPVKELADDPQYAATINKTMEELTTQKISTLKMPGFRADEQSNTLGDVGVLEGDEIAWLMLQREIFERTGEHIETNYYTFFPGSRRAESPALVPGGFWSGDSLFLDAYVASSRFDDAGCRLAGRINL